MAEFLKDSGFTAHIVSTLPPVKRVRRLPQHSAANNKQISHPASLRQTATLRCANGQLAPKSGQTLGWNALCADRRYLYGQQNAQTTSPLAPRTHEQKTSEDHSGSTRGTDRGALDSRDFSNSTRTPATPKAE
ncbi:hypothetical protein E2C01_057210 [Portunus trituberculatus]|uniref:Uncharacterized protein n=1 Tax=Portunus trituberculatus TaxID=210409 RepID=A0A5B7GZW0_PORTR|nr:hypothetical protein [Portunus trituberculatus]